MRKFATEEIETRQAFVDKDVTPSVEYQYVLATRNTSNMAFYSFATFTAQDIRVEEFNPNHGKKVIKLSDDPKLVDLDPQNTGRHTHLSG